jgi:hypothetical protein
MAMQYGVDLSTPDLPNQLNLDAGGRGVTTMNRL